MLSVQSVQICFPDLKTRDTLLLLHRFGGANTASFPKTSLKLNSFRFWSLILKPCLHSLFTSEVHVWEVSDESTSSRRSFANSAAPAVCFPRCLALNTLPLEARPLITITAACCHSVYWVSQWVILWWATLLFHTHTLFHLSLTMKGIYQPAIPGLHPLTVTDWHSSPSRLTFTNLSAPCALKSCYFAVYYCPIQKQFFSMHLWQQRSFARWCEKTCEKVCDLFYIASGCRHGDAGLTLMLMGDGICEWLNGFNGNLQISNSSMSLRNCDVNGAEGLWEHKLNHTDMITHLQRFRLTEKLPC